MKVCCAHTIGCLNEDLIEKNSVNCFIINYYLLPITYYFI